MGPVQNIYRKSIQRQMTVKHNQTLQQNSMKKLNMRRIGNIVATDTE